MPGPQKPIGEGRRRSRLIALAGACLALAFAAAPAPAGAQPFRTGLFDTTAFNSGEQIPFNRAAGAGAQFIRLRADWSQIAPPVRPPAGWDASDPASNLYDFAGLDKAVIGARAAGLSPMILVFGAPRWSERCREEDHAGTCNPNPQAFAEFGQALARRYSGGFVAEGEPLPQVFHYQAWNEPNLKMFFNPQRSDPSGDTGEPISPTLYRDLLNNFYDAVKAVNPENVIVAAGLGPYGSAPDTPPLWFMRELLCMKGRANPVQECDTVTKLDIWAMHPYTQGGPRTHGYAPDHVGLADLPKMVKLLRAAERDGQIESEEPGRVGFWITEISWDSSPPDPGGVPPGLQARWMNEAFFKMWRLGISTAIWFQLRDETLRAYGPDHKSFQSGLYNRGEDIAGDLAKPALRAFRFPLYAKRRDRTVFVWGRQPSGAATEVVIEMLPLGARAPVRLGTVPTGPDGVFRAVLPADRDRSRGASVRARIESGPFSRYFELRHIPDRHVLPFGDL